MEADYRMRCALVSHVIFVVMVVQLSATTTKHLRDDREIHGMSYEMRLSHNPFVPFATELLENIQGRVLTLVRLVLRTDNVRGVLQHYQSRRNACTRRTMRLARGIES